ncbi:MAG: SIR2 family protein [Thermodesulfobacteriota bacterium]
MKRIVYITGAGFSAPLGLPLISNFFEKAKDLHSQDPKNSGYIELDRMVRKFSILKNYFNVNLHNIEELLSISDMKDLIVHNNSREKIVDIIEEVIGETTPTIEIDDSKLQSMFLNKDNLDCFSSFNRYGQYLSFVSHIHGVNIQYEEDKRVRWHKIEPSTKIHYDIITLNYDMVLENICDFMNTNPHVKRDGEKILFKRKRSDGIDANSSYLIKLHGSIDDKETIVPPTWRKGDHDEKIREQWEVATELLANANHIIFLGYSLPENDNHIRYLLQSSITDTKITSIRTVNDDKKAVERYRELFSSIVTEEPNCQSYLQRFQQVRGERYSHSDYPDNRSFIYNGSGTFHIIF